MTEAQSALLSQPAVLVALVVIAIIEVGLMLWGVIDWARRPAEQIRGNRFLWLALILLVNIVGPIVYLTVGRAPAQATDGAAGQVGDRTSAVDSLYGPSGDDTGRG